MSLLLSRSASDADQMEKLRSRLKEVLKRLEKGDEELAREIIDGLDYRPLLEDDELSPRERSEQFLKELVGQPG